MTEKCPFTEEVQLRKFTGLLNECSLTLLDICAFLIKQFYYEIKGNFGTRTMKN